MLPTRFKHFAAAVAARFTGVSHARVHWHTPEHNKISILVDLFSVRDAQRLAQHLISEEVARAFDEPDPQHRLFYNEECEYTHVEYPYDIQRRTDVRVDAMMEERGWRRVWGDTTQTGCCAIYRRARTEG